MSFEAQLRQVGVIPLVQATTPEVAVATGRALLAGGLPVLEVVLRTPEALDCLGALCAAFPDAVVGAGTVLNSDQVEAASAAGARFIVSPGLDAGVVAAGKSLDLPVLPGIATATELQQAWNLGLRQVKFFPASLAGGPEMIKALGAAFRDMRFVPTGGVSAANLAAYLALPNVLACGGSWLTPSSAIDAQDFSHVTALAAAAAGIARAARGGGAGAGAVQSNEG